MVERAFRPNDTRTGRRHNRSIFLDLRDGMQYRLYGWGIGMAWSNGSGDPNDTGARHGILVQSTGLHSLRQTQCFAPAFASRLHNRSNFLDLRDGIQYRLYGMISRGRGARVPNRADFGAYRVYGTLGGVFGDFLGWCVNFSTLFTIISTRLTRICPIFANW